MPREPDVVTNLLGRRVRLRDDLEPGVGSVLVERVRQGRATAEVVSARLVYNEVILTVAWDDDGTLCDVRQAYVRLERSERTR